MQQRCLARMLLVLFACCVAGALACMPSFAWADDEVLPAASGENAPSTLDEPNTLDVPSEDTPSATDALSATDTPSATDTTSVTDTPSATDTPFATPAPDDASDDSQASVPYDTPLPEGDYLIQTSLGGPYVIDVSGGSKEDAANIQLYEYNGSDAQKWHVSYDEDGYYSFTSLVSDKLFDLAAGNARNSGNIHQYTDNQSLAQKWILIATGAFYTIASAIDPTFVIDVSAGRAANGTNIQVYTSNDTYSQKFAFISLAPNLPNCGAVEDGVYTIASAAHDEYVLDVAAGSQSNGANVQLYEGNNSYAQRWGIVANSDGLYTIFNMGSGKSLDVAAGNPIMQANVQQYQINDSPAQQWSLNRDESGAYVILSAISGLALDIAGGRFSNGTNISMYLPNESAAQQFLLERAPLVEAGSFVLNPSANPSLAADVPAGSIADGVALQVYSSNGSLAQHVYVKTLSDNAVTMQMVNSGRYLIDEDGAIVQRYNRNDDSQIWDVSLAKGGLVFTNRATGKVMSLASDTPKNGTSLIAQAAPTIASSFVLRPCDIISQGLYTFTSLLSKTGRVLDIASGSWSAGANVQLYASNDSNAQKWAVQPMEDGYYRIVAVFSGLALDVAGGSLELEANVNVWSQNGSDAQLWLPVLTDDGLTFVSKRSGLSLAVANDEDANGANVCQNIESDSLAHVWRLMSTTVDMSDLNTIIRLVRGVSGSGSLTASFDVASSYWNELVRAIQAVWNNGFSIGFMMTDLQSCNYVAMNADRTYYGASTMKGAYCTWIMEQYVETGRVSWGSVSSLIRDTIVDSNNDTYETLVNRFGMSGFNSWINGAGVRSMPYHFTYYTPRELQLMWARIVAYESSDGAYTSTWRSTFDHSYYSMIHETLGSYKTTYTKPGWYPRVGNYGALDDSGIVESSNGKRYLLTVMSDINCYGDQQLERRVIKALDAIYNAYLL